MASSKEIAQLHDYGVPLELISAALHEPLAQLRTRFTENRLTPEDEALRNGMLQLAWMCQGAAMQIMESGHPEAKMTIMRTVLSKTAGLIGQETTQTQEETKEAITRLFSAQRAGVAPINTPAELAPAVIDEEFVPVAEQYDDRGFVPETITDLDPWDAA